MPDGAAPLAGAITLSHGVHLPSASIAGASFPHFTATDKDINKPSVAPRLVGNAGLCLIMGGTSIRLRLMTAETAVEEKLTWEDYAKLPENQGKSIADSADQFIELLASRIVEQASNHGVAPSKMKVIGLSVAGQVAKTGSETTISTVNTGVRFTLYPFSRKLLSALERMSGEWHDRLPVSTKALATGWDEFEIDSDKGAATLGTTTMLIKNDGEAGHYGECHHPMGFLVKHKDGTFGIIGTGVGGNSPTELGHTLMKNERTGKYEFIPFEEFPKRGLYQDGQFQTAPKGYTYSEHKIAGPWIAVNLIKRFMSGDYNGRTMKMMDALLTRVNAKIDSNNEEARASGSGEIVRHVTEQDLFDCEALARNDTANWAKKVRDSILKPLNSVIFGTTPAKYWKAKKTQDTDIESFLTCKLYEYKMEMVAELAEMTNTLRQNFPGKAIVWGSSIIEKGFAKDPECYKTLLEMTGATEEEVGFSRIPSAEERESQFVLDPLKALQN